MDDVSLAAPPPELLHRSRIRLWASARAAWGARELVWTLTEREFRARYKQAVLGVTWVILTPLIYMVAFTLIFQRVAKVDTGDVPYALFSLMGLVPWTFFSTSLNQGAVTLLTNKTLLNKVAYPREVFPIASVGVAAVDSLISLPAVAILFAAYGFLPKATIVWTPILLVVQFTFVLGVVILFSIVVVYLRDVRYLIPMVLQLGLFVTPIGYDLESVNSKWHGIFSFFNPLVPVIDGYRRTVLEGSRPEWDLLALGAVGALIYLVAGYALFRRFQGGIADVA